MKNESAKIIPFRHRADDRDIALAESCWIEGTPYFTRKAIGQFLEYADPQKAIDNLIMRNPHLGDPRWSVTLNLRAADGKEYPNEVYDPIGLQLIMMKSNQPKAVEYQIAVAQLVAAYARGELAAPAPAGAHAIPSHRDLVLSRPKISKFAFLALPHHYQDYIVAALDDKKLTLEGARDWLAERGWKLSHEAIASYLRAVRAERRSYLNQTPRGLLNG